MRSEDSDAALWLEATSGTERAFGALFDRHRQRVFRAAYRRTGNVADAEDIVAIVFLEAWRLRARVRVVDGSVLPWLLRVTANVSWNVDRSRRRHRVMLAKLPVPAPTGDHADVVADRLDMGHRVGQLHAALRRLPAVEREVVELCLVEELSTAAVAATLDIPEGTVKSRLHRARGRLRTDLQTPDIPAQASPSGSHIQELNSES